MLRNPEDVDDSDIEAVMEGEDTMSRVSGKVRAAKALSNRVHTERSHCIRLCVSIVAT